MKSFTSVRQKTGHIGENIAERWLRAHGFVIIERNFTVRGGEVDIIASKDGIIHFIEVKSVKTVRSVLQSYNPGENITPMKLKRLMAAVWQYRSDNPLPGPWQLDALIIWFNPVIKQAQVQWLQNINH